MSGAAEKVWSCDRRFNVINAVGESRTRLVVGLTLVTMVAEIAAGWIFGSMALTADGWHMGTHAAALGITLFAYAYARRHADDPSFSFGTGKVGVLGGFASAVGLAIVALLMAVESVHRLVEPREIRFTEAIVVASVGLAVNLASALLLREKHDHGHGHAHECAGADHNLKAAYLHVLADALTSVLAIVALVVGMLYGWVFLDPLIGVVGGLVIARWSYGLLRETSAVLLDRSEDAAGARAIREAVERDGDAEVTDLHVWKVSSNHIAAMVALTAREPRSPDHYKERLAGLCRLDHVSIEINPTESRNPAMLS
jgi:cation diffusion facilitator family transporter